MAVILFCWEGTLSMKEQPIMLLKDTEKKFGAPELSATEAQRYRRSWDNLHGSAFVFLEQFSVEATRSC